jgi:hypothetical protein
MAVYQGARPRLIALPGRPRIAEGAGLVRRRTRTAVRAGRRTNRLGLVLGVIVVAFLLAFFWLAQVVRQSATTYDIGRLQVARDRLESQEQDLRSNLNRLANQPAVRKLALEGGLTQLDAPLVVAAH